MAKDHFYHPTPPPFAWLVLAVTSCAAHDTTPEADLESDVAADAARPVEPDAATSHLDAAREEPSQTDAGMTESLTNSATSEAATTEALSLEPSPPDGGGEDSASESPFHNVTVAAQATSGFAGPRAGAPLKDGVVFVAATQPTEDTDSQPGVFIGRGNELETLYAGNLLSNPLDIDVDAAEETAYVADSLHFDDQGEELGGALLRLPLSGGQPVAFAIGYQPRALVVSPSGEVYFSGRDPESGEVGVFRTDFDSVTKLHVGAPLVDPSGLAVFADGRVLVADPRLSETTDDDVAKNLRGSAGVLLLAEGQVSVLAHGFRTGYPAGIALTKDESHLVVSGQGPDDTNEVYVFDVADPSTPAYVERGFASQSGSSGGLHRKKDANQFVWCDRAANGGTLYSISAD